MPIFLDPEKWFREPFAVVPQVVNEDGSIQHVYCDGARFHVISWSTLGRHCSEPDCEINREREKGRRMNGVRDNGCLCQRCNFRYKVDFMLPDALWERVHGPWNLLCGICIVTLIEGLDQFDYFDVLKLEEYNA